MKEEELICAICLNEFTDEEQIKTIVRGECMVKYFLLYNLLFNLYCPSVAKIFADLDENLPLGVVFCVDHESDIIFSIRDRDQG